MDKITFESVMEEIKKSLGEARLMSIEEVQGPGEDYPVGTKPEDKPNAKKPEPKVEPQDSSKAAMMQRVVDSDKPSVSAPTPAPVQQKGQIEGPNKVSTAQVAQGKTPEAPSTSTADAGGNTAAKPVNKPSPPASRPVPTAPKVDTAAIYAKHGVGSSDENAGAFHRAEAEIAAARRAAPSAPAPRQQPVSAPAPRQQPVSPPKPVTPASMSGVGGVGGETGAFNAANRPSTTVVKSPMMKKGLREQAIEKFKGGAADIQDLSGPNKVVGSKPREQHHGISEEEIDEHGPMPSTTTGLGGTHASGMRKTSSNINKAGDGLQQRSGAQRSGNQRRDPAVYAEEATKKVLKKLKEKKGEQPLGKTSTGQPGDTIDTQPTKPELVGYH